LCAVGAQNNIGGQAKILTPCMNCTQSPEGRGLSNLIAALACLESQPVFRCAVLLALRPARSRRAKFNW